MSNTTIDDVMSTLPVADRRIVQTALDAAAAEPMGEFVAKAAARVLADVLPPDRLAGAVRQLSAAFALISRSSRFLAEAMTTPVGRQSVASAVAMVAITGFAPGVPGAPGAKAWIIPRGGRGGVTVNWQVSAAGLRAMAEEDGYLVTAAAVFTGDLLLVPSEADPAVLGWEAAPGGPCAEPGEDEAPWAPVPLDDAAAKPPALRRAQPDRRWRHLAGFLVVARQIGSAEIRAWRFVGREVILERRASSDAYAKAVKKGDADNTWIQWPLEMAEKAAISYALRRGLVTLSDRLSNVLAVSEVEPAPLTEVSQPAARPRIMVPTTPTPALAPPPLDADDLTPEEQARIVAAEQAEARSK